MILNFKAKISKHGNSYSVYIPKNVYTNLDKNTEYNWNVYTSDLDGRSIVLTVPDIKIKDTKLETKIFNTEACTKHSNSMKGTCGCK